MIILNNELFDDGSIECFNFAIANIDDAYQVSLKTIESLFNENDFRRLFASNRDKGYISVGHLALYHNGMRIIEIQWG